MRKALIFFSLLALIAGCEFKIPGVDEQFGEQNFVSAVSMIELYNVRNGEYPQSLGDLEFLGDWDGIWLSAVRYEKTDSGYNLFIERGWAGKPSLAFPVEFKQGLGIQDTNVAWISE
ncbi:MAG: hypothetical protein ACFE0K_12430 [Alcanivorax sp.]|uniref:hypothetical protein n=1 Tax=Alcanivorax sp. TaxID=1872427 RepID=UPI003DA70624